MGEYIEREALIAAFNKDAERAGIDCPWDISAIETEIEAAPAADVVPAADLKEFAADVVYQYGYKIICNGRLHLTAGGLSTLESAFDILGWEDPKPFPEGECEMDGCHEYATCGTPTPDGYKRVCGKHFSELVAEIYTPVKDGDGNG